MKEKFGKEAVGIFGIGLQAENVSRKLNRGSKRKPGEDDEKDLDSSPDSDDEKFGNVKDILIEAMIPAKGDRPATFMYLATFEGYRDIECSWVRYNGMSKAAIDWWKCERELRYPGYTDENIPVYDAKTNTLQLCPSTSHFLSFLPAGIREQLGLPIETDGIISHIAKPEFNIRLFLDYFINMRVGPTVPCPDGKAPADAAPNSAPTGEDPPAPAAAVPIVAAGEPESESNDPPLRARRRLRLIVSSSSDDDSDRDCLDHKHSKGKQRYPQRSISKRGRCK